MPEYSRVQYSTSLKKEEKKVIRSPIPKADHPCVETLAEPLAYLPLLLNCRCLLNESLKLTNICYIIIYIF